MTTCWRVFGYGMMIYLSAMMGISPQYYEAASLDGANSREQFFKITLPLLSPATLFLLVTTFLSSMKVFQSVDILTQGGPARSTEVFVYLIYRPVRKVIILGSGISDTFFYFRIPFPVFVVIFSEKLDASFVIKSYPR